MAILAGSFERGYPSAKPVTVGDAARALHVTDEGVRHLERDGQLRCSRTPGGWRVFREGDVQRLADQRTRLHLAGKLPRRKKLGPRGEPRQLGLFSRVRIRLVRRRQRRRHLRKVK